MELTEDQKKASVAIIDFLMSQDAEELIITAQAGCGKTALVSWFLKEGYNKYVMSCIERDIRVEYPFTPVVVATTNKAAEVLNSQLDTYVSTIHKYLGISVRNNFVTGKTYLEKTSNCCMKFNQIIFIDECSMIDSQIYTYIKEFCKNCKIIYVGDKEQLTPVNSGISPIYSKLPNIPLIELKENVRLRNHPELLELANQLKDSVKYGEFKPIKVNKGVIKHLSGKDFKEMIDNSFLTTEHNNKILTYTNKKALDYNSYIKYDLRKYTDYFVKGEHYTVNSMLKGGNSDVLFNTDTEIVIEDVLNLSKYTDCSLPFEIIYLKVRNIYETVPYIIKVPVEPMEYIKAIKYEAKLKNWGAYFKLKETVADIRLADCSTVHKAQGSTYKNVFIDLTDLNTCRDPDTLARLLYVACTRATDNVYLAGNLDSKYGGLIE